MILGYWDIGIPRLILVLSEFFDVDIYLIMQVLQFFQYQAVFLFCYQFSAKRLGNPCFGFQERTPSIIAELLAFLKEKPAIAFCYVSSDRIP